MADRDDRPLIGIVADPFRVFRAPWARLALVALVSVACGLLALGLQPSTGVNTLVSSSSRDYQATQRAAQQFGSSPVVVLVREPLSELLAERQLTRISTFEACLGGERLAVDTRSKTLQPVAGGVPYGGWASPCATLMRERPVNVVYGPGGFLNHAVAAVNAQIAGVEASAASAVAAAKAEARKLAAARGEDAALQAEAAKVAGELALEQQLKSVGGLASELEQTGEPSLANTTFLRSVVFGSAGSGRPSSRFSYLFPDADSALIQVRLKADLSAQQQTAAIALIRAAARMPQFRLTDGSYTVTGEPVVLTDLAAGIAGQLLVLLIGAVVVMALVLLAIFRRRPRLVPLLVALCAAAVTFGLAALVGASLTMAAVAVLPVLIGLAVDYSVQLQSGTSHASVVVAGVATAAGFLALVLSPVPMVRGFGVLLVAGVLVSLVIVRVVVPAVDEIGGATPAAPRAVREAGAILAAPRAVREAGAILAAPRAVREAGAILADAWLGAADILRSAARRLRRPPARMSLTTVIERIVRGPVALLVVGAILAAGGWALDARTAVQSDITKLVPSGTPALRDLNALERVTGTSGEIDVLVHAHDVASPQVVDWMASYEERVVRRFGGGGDGCATASLCPAFSLPSLLATGGAASRLNEQSIDALLRAVPAYFTRAVITPRRDYATLSFGIRLMPLSEQRKLIDSMRTQLHPPRGVSAELTGLPVLAADADASLSSATRRVLTVLLGLLLVASVLLAIFRDLRRALVPLGPIVLATGWSALIVYLLRIPLNPLSATLGALVIAISTEFSVLLSERIRSTPGTLVERVVAAYRTTGLAIVTSGVTVIVGFAVLILSDITMLRDFGLVTLVDLTVSLAGVLVALPAVLAASERGAER